jgi:S-adenosyl-L-methionine hydrolase (adenosine-forming)
VARPLIALVTDFGARDHYVGTMKGAMLAICADIALVDITHEVPPHDIIAGAIELGAAYRHFPPGTTFLAVVDPGVGSARRGLGAEAGGYRFVAPDNGVLSVVFEETPPDRVVGLSNPRYSRAEVSRTFEGRDRFGPAAVWLATGVDLAELGPAIHDWVRVDVPKARATREGIDGAVVRVDRFGNLVTNIDRPALEAAGPARLLTVHVGDDGAGRPLSIVGTYGDVAAGEICALIGSTNHLEIAVNGASAAARLGASRGARVRVISSAACD